MTSLLNSVLDITTTESNLTFGSRLSQNSESPEYHLSGQLSQLPDCLMYGSRRLMIYELHLSELDRVAES
jgi:hypothetical protein